MQGPVTEENVKNIKYIVSELKEVIAECYWVYTLQEKTSKFTIEDCAIQLISVEDPGAIEVAVPPHYANTNRMIATTKVINDIKFTSRQVLKIRSDISLENRDKFIEWIRKINFNFDKIHVITRANHNWSLPYNMGDWIYFGDVDFLKKLISNVNFVHPTSGVSGKISMTRLLYGYCKFGFSPEYTTEQVVGAMMFNFKEEINSANGFRSWVKIKNEKIKKYDIKETGLECKKYNDNVSKSYDHSFRLPYVTFNFLKNFGRLMIR